MGSDYRAVTNGAISKVNQLRTKLVDQDTQTNIEERRKAINDLTNALFHKEAHVFVYGLKAKPELNGRCGFVVEELNENNRLGVKVFGETEPIRLFLCLVVVLCLLNLTLNLEMFSVVKSESQLFATLSL